MKSFEQKNEEDRVQRIKLSFIMLACFFALILFLVGCTNRPTNIFYPELNKFDYNVGDLYSFNKENNTYGVLKIIGIDETSEGTIISAKIYKNTYSSTPKENTLGDLSVGTIYDKDGYGVGHLPILKGAFEIDILDFIKNEPVQTDELEGYNYWKGDTENGAGAFNEPINKLV